MRNPIQNRGARATRPIHYPPGSPGAFRDCGSPGFVRATKWRRTGGERLVLWISLVLALLFAAACGDTDSGAGPENESGRGSALSGPGATSETDDSPRGAASSARAERDAPVIVFLGTSITAGYGLEESQAYPALIQDRIDEAELDYRVINAGVSGDTSAGGLRRLAWLLRLPVSVLVLELGANDMLRGQGVEQLRTNLETILEQASETHPGVGLVVAGMRAAPNLGLEYGTRFDAVYPALASSHDAALIPFLLEDVAARRHLNQADGIHPTAEGHALIAERVWKTLEPVLRR
jgi:acyl-CoA thioesterase-1